MFLKKLTYKYNLTELFLLLISFLIPLEKTTMRIAIVVIAIVAFIKGNYKVLSTKSSLLKLTSTLLWIFPFLQLLILNELNIHWSHLETKLSLLLFPVIILLVSELKKDFIYELLRIFIIGCSLSIVICLIHSSYDLIIYKDSNSFFYKRLSFLHHPGYYAMYLNFAIGLIYLNMISSDSKLKIENKWSWTLIIAFTLFIVLISSRTGWISNLIINSVFIIILIKMKFFNRKHLITGFVMLFALGGLVNLSTSLKNRFNEIIKYTIYAKEQSSYPSSTSTRIKAWESAGELIKKNWLFGLGTGRGGVELNKTYDSKEYFSLKKKKYQYT